MLNKTNEHSPMGSNTKLPDEQWTVVSRASKRLKKVAPDSPVPPPTIPTARQTATAAVPGAQDVEITEMTQTETDTFVARIQAMRPENIFFQGQVLMMCGPIALNHAGQKNMCKHTHMLAVCEHIERLAAADPNPSAAEALKDCGALYHPRKGDYHELALEGWSRMVFDKPDAMIGVKMEEAGFMQAFKAHNNIIINVEARPARSSVVSIKVPPSKHYVTFLFALGRAWLMDGVLGKPLLLTTMKQELLEDLSDKEAQERAAADAYAYFEYLKKQKIVNRCWSLAVSDAELDAVDGVVTKTPAEFEAMLKGRFDNDLAQLVQAYELEQSKAVKKEAAAPNVSVPPLLPPKTPPNPKSKRSIRKRGRTAAEVAEEEAAAAKAPEEAAAADADEQAAAAKASEEVADAEAGDRGDNSDGLTGLLAARQQQLDADAAMRVQVQATIGAQMDVGMRVNASLAQALGVTVRPGSGGAEEEAAAEEEAEEEKAELAEISDDDKEAEAEALSAAKALSAAATAADPSILDGLAMEDVMNKDAEEAAAAEWHELDFQMTDFAPLGLTFTDSLNTKTIEGTIFEAAMTRNELELVRVDARGDCYILSVAAGKEITIEEAIHPTAEAQTAVNAIRLAGVARAQQHLRASGAPGDDLLAEALEAWKMPGKFLQSSESESGASFRFHHGVADVLVRPVTIFTRNEDGSVAGSATRHDPSSKDAVDMVDAMEVLEGATCLPPLPPVPSHSTRSPPPPSPLPCRLCRRCRLCRLCHVPCLHPPQSSPPPPPLLSQDQLLTTMPTWSSTSAKSTLTRGSPPGR